MASNGSGPKASETKKERRWSREKWARWWSRWKWALWLSLWLFVAIWGGFVIYLLGWYVPGVIVRHEADTTVETAWISGVATLLGVGATAAVAIFAFWYARLTLKDQGKQLDKTLDAQGKQLDKTLAEQRTRTLNERFATAAGQLGDDKPSAVRLAGVYAMAGLADDWADNRQTCVDVLCAYLRLPYDPDPGDEAPEPKRLAFRASREVRHTVIRVITAHLQADMAEAKSWRSLDFDFTGVVFDGGDFTDARFSGGTVDFSHARFSGGTVDFRLARFSGGTVDFSDARFSGGTVDFSNTQFSDGCWVDFSSARFSDGGTVDFSDARFSGGTVDFIYAEFSGGTVDFSRAHFSGGTVEFSDARFSGGRVDFSAWFSGGTVDFSTGLLLYRADKVKLIGGVPLRSGAWFSGGAVDFRRAKFSGGTVDFSYPSDWSRPPVFSWTGTPPPGVKLPNKEDPSQE